MDNADAPYVLVAHLVVKNEADRYLHNCITALIGLVDHIHVFDDKSTDETPFICDSLGAEVHVRPGGCPSFLEHEGQFRQAAWESMGTLPDDSWILCTDADEFFAGPVRPVATGMNKSFKVEEIFEVVDGNPMARVDGFWDQITVPRLAKWTPEAEFPDKEMACGSFPKAIAEGPFELVSEPRILHYGYVKLEDREEKYRRYRSRPGHNRRHVESIPYPKELRRIPDQVD